MYGNESFECVRDSADRSQGFENIHNEFSLQFVYYITYASFSHWPFVCVFQSCVFFSVDISLAKNVLSIERTALNITIIVIETQNSGKRIK